MISETKATHPAVRIGHAHLKVADLEWALLAAMADDDFSLKKCGLSG
ncbi:MAG: hypothetical protein QOD99_776 [Chthoniobacter sp.]|jgi:hypothetical protein|nr:hypothetical protein [Chthoniobacter sp.]